MTLANDRLYQFIFKNNEKLYYYDDKFDEVYSIIAYDKNDKEIIFKLERGILAKIKLNSRKKSCERVTILERWMSVK